MSSTANSSDITSPDESTRSAGVSFSNDVEKQQSTFAKKSSTELRAARDRQSLSASAKAWDLDGDGELDDAELALKSLDTSNKGYLSKDQMYQLMSKNLQTQRELFKVKKIVIGLVVFTCILALSNLGTSFAAAFLAKDTTTNNDELVDAKSGNTLETEAHRNNYVVDSEFNKEYNRRRRHLCEVSGGQTKTADCASTSAIAVPTDMGRSIAQNCWKGHNVGITLNFASGSITKSLCGSNADESYPVTTDDSQWVGNGGQRSPKWVAHNGKSVMPNTDDTAYELEGFESSMSEFCTVDTDCGSNMSCFQRLDQTKVCLCANNNACPSVIENGVAVEGVCALQQCGLADSTPTCTSDAQARSNGFCQDTHECTGDLAQPRDYTCTLIQAEEVTTGGGDEKRGMLESCEVDSDCDVNLSCFQRMDASKVCLCANHSACPSVIENGVAVEGVCALRQCGMSDPTPTCTSDAGAKSSGFCQDSHECTGDANQPRDYTCTLREDGR